MKKIIFILFFHLFTLQGYANIIGHTIAEKTHKDSIFGRITDATNRPIIGVDVYCKKNKYGTITNFDGEFSLAKEKIGEQDLTIAYIGYKTIIIPNEKIQNSSFIEITLEEDIIEDIITLGGENSTIIPCRHYHRYHRYYRYFRLSIWEVDYFPYNFNSFSDILPKDACDVLKTDGCFGLGFYYNYRGYMIGISEKIMTNYKYNSHKRYYNYLGISFLYDLLNLKNFHLGAETAIDWNICKYIYRESAYKISLEEYLQQKNINLNFSQFTHYLGLNFHFSIPLYQHQNKFIIGMRGGYVYKMHKYPIIRTDHNRVINSHRPIDLDNYKMGIYMGLQFSH